jgi:hypothetical protein
MCVERLGPAKDTLRTLLPGRGLELGHQLSGHLSAVFRLDPLRLGPLAELSAVQPEADSTFGLAAEARSQGAGRQDGASDSDPLTLAA